MTYLIHGATGAQGAPVAASLARSGIPFAAAIRNPSTYAGPYDTVEVDLADADSLDRAYQDASGVFVHLPVGTPDHQRHQASSILAALQRARPPRVVMSTSGYTYEEQSPLGILVDGLRESGISYAVIEPRLFLENLLLPTVLGPVKDDGVLAYPIRDDYALSWTSHLDVADVAVRLLEDHSHTGSVGVGALPGLVGDDLAAGFAKHFGRGVNFRSQTPAEFGAQIAPLFGEAAVAPIVDSYEWRVTQPNELIEPALSAQLLLNMTPRTVEQWLADCHI